MADALAESPFSVLAQDRYSHPRYTVRRKIFTLFGAAFEVFDAQGNLAFFCRKRPFRWKDEIRVYGDEGERIPLLVLQARSVFDFGATFDVTDATTGERVGALRRKGLASLLRDEWAVLDLDDQEIGTLQEDSLALALVRRFLFRLIPQSWNLTLGGAEVAAFHQHFNPFVLKVSLDFSPDVDGRLDRRLGIALAVLLDAVEGRQQRE